MDGGWDQLPGQRTVLPGLAGESEPASMTLRGYRFALSLNQQKPGASTSPVSGEIFHASPTPGA